MSKKTVFILSSAFIFIGCEPFDIYSQESSFAGQTLKELQISNGQTIETRKGANGTVHYVPQPQIPNTLQPQIPNTLQSQTTNTPQFQIPINPMDTMQGENQDIKHQLETLENELNRNWDTALQTCKTSMPSQAPLILPVCERTEAVKKAILRAVRKTDCSQVTLQDLRNIGSLTVYNPTSLKAGDFSGLVVSSWLTIQNAQLDLPANAFSNLIVGSWFIFKNSQIGNIAPNALSGLFVCSWLVFERNTHIETISSNAFSGSAVGSWLVFQNSQIESISSNAFSNLTVGSWLLFKNTQIGSIFSNAFSNLTVGSWLLFKNSWLNHIAPGAFSNLKGNPQLVFQSPDNDRMFSESEKNRIKRELSGNIRVSFMNQRSE